MTTAAAAFTLSTSGIATLRLSSGKSNTLTHSTVRALRQVFHDLAKNKKCRAIILTSAHPKLFSPGLDLHETFAYKRREMQAFMRDFTLLLHAVFTHPKPVIAAINGHAVAGGFCLAMACDFRLMADTAGVVGLNELKIGVALPFGVVEILKAALPPHVVKAVILHGNNYRPAEALAEGLIDEVIAADSLARVADERAVALAEKSPAALALMKSYWKREAAAAMAKHERRELKRFLDVWFAPETRARLQSQIDTLNSKTSHR